MAEARKNASSRQSFYFANTQQDRKTRKISDTARQHESNAFTSQYRPFCIMKAKRLPSKMTVFPLQTQRFQLQHHRFSSPKSIIFPYLIPETKEKSEENGAQQCSRHENGTYFLAPPSQAVSPLSADYNQRNPPTNLLHISVTARGERRKKIKPQDKKHSPKFSPFRKY